MTLTEVIVIRALAGARLLAPAGSRVAVLNAYAFNRAIIKKTSLLVAVRVFYGSLERLPLT